MPSNALPLHLEQTFSPLIWIFTECEGDEIESRQPFKIFSTLPGGAGNTCQPHKSSFSKLHSCHSKWWVVVAVIVVVDIVVGHAALG